MIKKNVWGTESKPWYRQSCSAIERTICFVHDKEYFRIQHSNKRRECIRLKDTNKLYLCLMDYTFLQEKAMYNGTPFYSVTGKQYSYLLVTTE